MCTWSSLIHNKTTVNRSRKSRRSSGKNAIAADRRPQRARSADGGNGTGYRSSLPTVSCLERDVLQPNYTTYIRSDNDTIGRMAGGFIVDHLKKKYGAPRGIVVQIRGLLGVEGEINRDHGAKAVSPISDIKIVEKPVADWIQAKAKDHRPEGLRVQPKIDVVYGHNDPIAAGADGQRAWAREADGIRRCGRFGRASGWRSAKRR